MAPGPAATFQAMQKVASGRADEWCLGVAAQKEWADKTAKKFDGKKGRGPTIGEPSVSHRGAI
eukprot:8653763-Pyramimonas_sp.AAC.1